MKKIKAPALMIALGKMKPKSKMSDDIEDDMDDIEESDDELVSLYEDYENAETPEDKAKALKDFIYACQE